MTVLGAPLARVLGLEPHELGRAAALFALSFVLGLSLVTFDLALSTNLVLGLDPSELPWSQVVLAVTVPAAGALLGWARPRLSVTRFVTLPLAAVALAGLGLLAFVGSGPPGMGVLLALWATEHVLTAVAVVSFWTVASRTYGVSESRRVYGVVGAGELVAGLTGGLVAASLQDALSLRALLAIAMTGVLAGVLLAVPLARRIDPSATAAAPERDAPAERAALGGHGWRCLAYHAAGNVTFDVVQFLVLVSVQREHAGSAGAVAGVLGPLLAARVGLGAVLQLFVAGRLLGRRGLGVGLLAAPVVVVSIASLAFVLGASQGSVFTAVVVLQIGDAIVRSGLGKPAFMAAQNPMLPAARERTLLLMETAVEPITTGLGGAALLAVPSAWLSSAALILFPLPVAAAWLAVAAGLSRSYRRLTTQGNPPPLP